MSSCYLPLGCQSGSWLTEGKDATVGGKSIPFPLAVQVLRTFFFFCVITPFRFELLVMAASLGAFACYFLAALLHGAMISLMVVIVQYLYMLPTYVNMFSIYSFCNMHDISWGTKEGETVAI